MLIHEHYETAFEEDIELKEHPDEVEDRKNKHKK